MRKLDPEFVGALSAAIRGRSAAGPIRWSDVVALSASMGVPCSRQSLCKDEKVAKAYEDARIARRGGTAAPEPDTSLGRANARISKLRAELLARDETIRCYDRKLIALLQAAREAGLDVDRLARATVRRDPSGEDGRAGPPS